MTNKDYEYLDADQREAIKDQLQAGHERSTSGEFEAEAGVDENTDQFTVASGGASVAVTYSRSAGVVSAANEHLDEGEFLTLESELETVAAHAGVGEPALHERMSEFASYRIDYQ